MEGLRNWDELLAPIIPASSPDQEVLVTVDDDPGECYSGGSGDFNSSIDVIICDLQPSLQAPRQPHPRLDHLSPF